MTAAKVITPMTTTMTIVSFASQNDNFGNLQILLWSIQYEKLKHELPLNPFKEAGIN